MTRAIINLAKLSEGQTGTIYDIDTTSPTSQRLLDLGFVPGTRIKAVQHAPMGDPTTFEIRGYRVGLRNSEALLIDVDAIKDDKDAKNAN